MQYTCLDTSTDNNESVAQTEKQWSQVDMPEGVECWQLRENYHHYCYHCYELVQLQGSVRRKTWVHDLHNSNWKSEKEWLSNTTMKNPGFYLAIWTTNRRHMLFTSTRLPRTYHSSLQKTSDKIKWTRVSFYILICPKLSTLLIKFLSTFKWYFPK